MSDSIDTGEDKDGLVPLKRSQIKILEQKARQYDEAVSRAEKAERGLAFAQAGIPLNDKRFTWFVKGYDGDTDPEAIREAAVESGLLEDTSRPSPEQQQEQQAQSRIEAASRGQSVATEDVDAAMAAALESGGVDALSQYLAAQGVPLAED